MPRLKDKDAERRRVARACDSCRRRKEKCDSLQPCAGCTKRNIKCEFSAAFLLKKRKIIHLNEEVDGSDAEVAIDRCINTGATIPSLLGVASDNVSEESPAAQAPVPRTSRMLRDSRGKQFIYIGDSASLAFLQNVRRIVHGVIGECELSRDRLRHSFLEQMPSEKSAATILPSGIDTDDMRLTWDQTELLVNSYLTATAGILDLFDSKQLLEDLRSWLSAATAVESTQPIYYLVMAIGAQVAADHELNSAAERYFARGRQMAFMAFTDEPSIQTVQSFLLITLYMLGETRRNAAFMNLGMAVRAAHALGLHRGDIQTLFSAPERQSRVRVWQSLRAVDLFLSASLGRPPATSDSVVIESFDKDHVSNGAKLSAAILRLVSIFEQVLNEVYKKRTVSTDAADTISRLYREWTAQLPPLPVELVNGPTLSPFAEIAQSIATAHLISAYHWSIVLLTRPFLIFQVSLNQSRKKTGEAIAIEDPAGVSTISTYSEASIDSAISGLEAVSNLLQRDGLPRRLPFITNCVFNFALAVGVATFGDFDRTYPLRDEIERAEQILITLSAFEPQARRYAQLVGFLTSAAKTYVYQRDRSSMQHRRKKKSDLFGNVETDSALSPQPSTSNKSTGSPLAADLGRGEPGTKASSNIPAASIPENVRGNRLTPPESRASADILSFALDRPILTTSGFLVSDQAPGAASNLSVPLFDESLSGWTGFGTENMDFAEMMPMFDLFSEPAPEFFETSFQ